MLSVSAWMYLVFWFGSQLLSLKHGNPGIDYPAHIVGFVFGYLFASFAKLYQQFNPVTGEWEWVRL